MTIGFGGMDFSTGETSVSGGAIVGCAFVLGAVGALVGWVAGSRITQSPGVKGKRIGFWLGLFIPLQAFFFVLVYAAVVSVILAIVSIFSPGVLGYQRGLILLGVWVVSILVSIFTVTDNGQDSVDLRGGRVREQREDHRSRVRSDGDRSPRRLLRDCAQGAADRRWDPDWSGLM